MLPIMQALAAANLGVETLEMGQLDKARCGILIGSAMGGMNTFSTAIEALHKQVGCPVHYPSVGQACQVNLKS